MNANQERFKSYLRKIGSGEHTSHGMCREESADALKLILMEQATPAQIGAFMMAHRIRRPEPQELAGMLDTYLELGANVKSIKTQRNPVCFGMPFDGRCRTEPIYPLTSLILVSLGQPVVLTGGKRMPTKYGISTVELFSELNLNLTGLTDENLQNCFSNCGFALMHQPDHFPLAEKLISYREEIGKRPPIASMELLWTPHIGEHILISGFVHPPTEDRAWKTIQLMGKKNFISVKGLEGGTDLPINRACITKRFYQNMPERIILHAKEHQCSGKDMEWSSLKEWQDHALKALENQGPLKNALRWNAGIYLWFAGIANSLEDGLHQAEACMESRLAQKTLEKIIAWRRTTTS